VLGVVGNKKNRSYLKHAILRCNTLSIPQNTLLRLKCLRVVGYSNPRNVNSPAFWMLKKIFLTTGKEYSLGMVFFDMFMS